MAKRGEHEGKKYYVLLSHEEKIRQQLLGDPIVDRIDALLHQAIIAEASDIHFQPEGNILRVRYRIDGVLYDQEAMSAVSIPQAMSRIKVLSNLDSAERHVPQDGTFKVLVNPQSEHPIDMRVSTFPCTYGEKVVIRILNRSKNILDLISLGIDTVMMSHIKRFCSTPYGLFLVTGPTGAGKTTSLYAMLSEMNHTEKNIVTMEDPVEFDVLGVTQSQINTRLGITFENGLRSMLRQDPDVMMVGEIRDVPTVKMAIEAALTGHLVLSTLHTNNAIGVITRLLDMGIEPFLINAALIGVLAQRLVRKLCNVCKRQDVLTKDEQAFFMSKGIELSVVWRATGCSSCAYRGYQGRTGIFELLSVNDTIRQCITQNPSAQCIQQVLEMEGFQSMLQHGIQLVQQGIVALEELLAVLG